MCVLKLFQSKNSNPSNNVMYVFFEQLFCYNYYTYTQKRLVYPQKCKRYVWLTPTHTHSHKETHIRNLFKIQLQKRKTLYMMLNMERALVLKTKRKFKL